MHASSLNRHEEQPISLPFGTVDRTVQRQFETTAAQEHLDSAAEEPEATARNPGPIEHIGNGIQQESDPNCQCSGEDSGGNQHDREVCSDLVSEPVCICAMHLEFYKELALIPHRRAKIKLLAKKSLETGEDIDSIPESMRAYLAMQAMESGKGLGGPYMGRTGLMPYGSMMLGGEQGGQGKVRK